jgi:signal transduction histidine kinase
MARSNQNLLKMVNTLLEVYRYEAGRKSLNFFPVDLRELICEVAEELAPLANAKGLSLKLDLAESAGNCNGKICTAVGDRLELHRLITNLVGNAIQFTDAGVVEIRLKAAPPPPAAHLTDGNIPWIAIEVEDTGQGIGAADRERIFERFLQGNHKRSGSGLGLHLSRQIVEAHQGTIEVMSELGKGSLFAVRLPTRQVA